MGSTSQRFRRIYPALFALIPISVTLAWLVNRDMLVGIRNQIMTVLLGCYNWYAISSGASYFSQMNPDIFRHLWFMSLLMQVLSDRSIRGFCCCEKSSSDGLRYAY